MFKKEAELHNMQWTSPLKKYQSQFQHQYFKEFIEPQQMQHRHRNGPIGLTSRTSKGTLKGQETENFIPLSDLLKRNHNDRVQYHLQ